MFRSADSSYCSPPVADKGVKQSARLRDVRCMGAVRPSTDRLRRPLRVRQNGGWHYGLHLILSRREAPSRRTHNSRSAAPIRAAAGFFTTADAGAEKFSVAA
jgi:hypothetical protein